MAAMPAVMSLQWEFRGLGSRAHEAQSSVELVSAIRSAVRESS